MSVRDSLAQKLIEVLTSVSGTTEFRVTTDISTFTNERFKREINVSYTQTTTKPYIVAGMSLSDTPSGAPQIDKTQWGITIQFGLQGKTDLDPYLVRQKQAIEDFRLELLNNSVFNIDANGDTYNCKIVAGALQRVGEIQSLAGVRHPISMMQLTCITGKGITFGEEIQYFLNGPDFGLSNLYPIEKSSALAIEHIASQSNNEVLTGSTVNKSTWVSTMTVKYESGDPALRSLLNTCLGRTDPDEVYDLTISGNGEDTRKDVSVQGTADMTTGAEITMTLTFTELRTD